MSLQKDFDLYSGLVRTTHFLHTNKFETQKGFSFILKLSSHANNKRTNKRTCDRLATQLFH